MTSIIKARALLIFVFTPFILFCSASRFSGLPNILGGLQGPLLQVVTRVVRGGEKPFRITVFVL
jgi:hypothetical protein